MGLLNKIALYIMGYSDLNSIIIQDSFKNAKPKAKKVDKAREYFDKNGQFKDYIIVNRKNTLVDGYITYLLAKEMHICYIKVAKVR